jgi:hypothetical protein
VTGVHTGGGYGENFVQRVSATDDPRGGGKGRGWGKLGASRGVACSSARGRAAQVWGALQPEGGLLRYGVRLPQV